jgi:hypothetical protein
VLITHDDPLACAACEEALDAYVEAQIAGQSYAAYRPDVAAHLDACVSCSEAYAILYDLRLAEQRGHEPASIPGFDMSFLPAASPVREQAATSLRMLLAEAVERTGERLRLQLSHALVTLLPPPAAQLGALRGELEDAALLELSLEGEGPFERLRLIVYPQAGEPKERSVRIQVEISGRSWPDLADLPVRLDMVRASREQTTDAWGEVVFDHVPADAIPNLAVEIDAGATPTTT